MLTTIKWEISVTLGPAMLAGLFSSQAGAWDHTWQWAVKCLSLSGGRKRGVETSSRFAFEKSGENAAYTVPLLERQNLHQQTSAFLNNLFKKAS